MGFQGWPPEVHEFYIGLEADNSKTYREAHKSVPNAKHREPHTPM